MVLSHMPRLAREGLTLTVLVQPKIVSLPNPVHCSTYLTLLSPQVTPNASQSPRQPHTTQSLQRPQHIYLTSNRPSRPRPSDMPPRKAAAASAATKPTTDDTKACSLILNYLVAQNRPFSATEISSNLHNAVAKARTDKLLKEMFERGEIAGRASGKQWVFWGLQVGSFLYFWGWEKGGMDM